MSSDARHPARISTAMVMANGLATVYRRWGSGRTVLLLGASEAVALALGDWFRVIVPELPLGLSVLGAAPWPCGASEGALLPAAAILALPASTAAVRQVGHAAPD